MEKGIQILLACFLMMILVWTVGGVLSTGDGSILPGPPIHEHDHECDGGHGHSVDDGHDHSNVLYRTEPSYVEYAATRPMDAGGGAGRVPKEDKKDEL